MENKSTELTVVNDEGYQYDLMNLPPQDSPRIVQAGKEILQDMQVESIIQNLENVARLMFVAYNALGGTLVQPKMSGLQKNYLDLMDDSEQAIITFEHRSQEICVYVARAYSWLLKGKEKMAITQFGKCAQAASEMARKAEQLAGGFRELGKEAEGVLEDSQTEQALQYQKMDEIKKQMDQYNAKVASLERTQKGLEAAITEINGIYEEAKKKEKEAFDLKKGMMIAQAVTSCISAVIPSVASMQGSSTGTAQSTSQASQKAQEDLQENEKNKADLEEEKKNITESLEKLKEEKEDLEKEIQDIDGKIKAEQGVTAKDEEEKQKAIEEYESKKQEKEEEAKKKEQEITDEEKKLDSVVKNLEAVGKTIERLNQQIATFTDQCRDDYAKAEAATERALEKKLEMEKQHRETLASIQEFTTLIQSSVRQKNVAETAVQTLQVAIRCIKQVVVALSIAARFWRSMEEYCKRLANSTVIGEITELEQGGLSVEERMEYYQDNMFKRAFLEYICRWAALYYVCGDYKRRNNKVRDMVANNIMSSASREEEWKVAGQLASELKVSIDEQVEDSNKTVEQLEGGAS